MKNNKSLKYLILGIYLLSACINDSETKRISPKISEIDKLETNEEDSTIKIYVAGDNKYVLLDTLKFKVPDNIAISSSNIYAGIYEFSDDSIARKKYLITKSHAFLTTFEDLGFGIRSRLYVFDILDRSLVKDSEFHHNYLYSSAGIFFIDIKSNKLFVVGKPEWYDAKKENILPASLYIIKDRMLVNEKNVYQVGSDISSEANLLLFFKNSILSSSVGVFELPKNWWKNK